MATRTIDLELALTGEKEFNNAMQSVNRNLKGLRADMSLVTAEFKNNADSTEALTAKNKILQQEIDQQKVKVDALAQMHEKAVEAYGEESKEADKWREALTRAQTTLVKMNNELDGNNAKLDENAEAVKDDGKAAEETESKLDKLRASVKDLGSAVAENSKSLLDGTGKVAGWTAKITAAAVAASGAALIAGTKTLLEWGSAAAESSQAAYDAGEKLSPAQEKWLRYNEQLTGLRSGAEEAKAALSSILLPAMGDFALLGGQLLDDFAYEMDAAAGNPERMGQIIAKYITTAAQRARQLIPQVKAIAANLLQGLGEGFSENGDELIAAAGDILDMLIQGIIDFAPEIGDAAGKILLTLGGELIDHAPDLLDAGIELMLKLTEGFIEALPGLLNRIPEIVSRIKDILIAHAPEMAMVAYALVNALLGALPDAFQSVFVWIGETVTAIVEWAINAINSVKSAISSLGDIGRGGGGGIMGTSGGNAVRGYATGLNYVPYDDFPALLHRGEMVLTRSQATDYRENGSAEHNKTTVPLTITIDNQMDGRTLSQLTYDFYIEINRQRGPSLVRR